MQVGDLVVRTYGEGQRPVAIFVGWHLPNIYSNKAKVMWHGTNKVTTFNAEHLKVINATR